MFASDSFARTRAISSSFLLKLALASSFTSSMAFPNATLNASTRFAIPFSVSNRCCFNSTFNFFTAKAMSALRSLTAAFAFLHSSSKLLIWSFLFSFSLVSCSFSLVSFPSFASLSLLSFSHFRSFSSNAFKHFSRSFSTSNRRSMCLLISSSASLRSPLNATAASSSARSARSARLDSFARDSLSLRNSACTSEVLCSIVNCRIRLSVSSFTEYSSDCVSFTTNSSASRFDSNVFVFSFVLSISSCITLTSLPIFSISRTHSSFLIFKPFAIDSAFDKSLCSSLFLCSDRSKSECNFTARNLNRCVCRASNSLLDVVSSPLIFEFSL